MNIALFSDSYLPTKSGVVTVVVQLREALEALGHHVVIVTVATGPESKKDSDPNILRLPSIPLGLGTDQFLGIPNIQRVKRYLRDNHVEIIHCHTEFNIAHAAKTVGRALRIPTIATTHTMWEDFYDYYVPMARIIPVKLIRKLVKQVYRKFYALINVSAKARDYFKEPFILPNTPSAIVANAIDTKAFCSKTDTPEDILKLRKAWNIAKDDVVLLFVGRIAEEKRVLELLEICMNVVHDRQGVKALFVGAGPALEQLQKTIQTERLDDKIITTGFVNWVDLHTYYRVGDVFLTASLSEMHSMTILEALICALPIVARKDSSYLDTIFSGENGYLEDTDQSMRDRIVELIEDPERRKAFGQRSQEISRRFSLETHARKTVAFYEAVIQSYPRPIDERELRARVDAVE